MSKKKVVIIGTSPISLFEAIYQHKIGNDVTILNKDDQIGGAWGTTYHGGVYNLEVGCHIWDVNKETYSFLESYLKERLEVLNPPPSIIYNRFRFSYDLKHNLLVFKTMRHDFKSYLFGKKNIKPNFGLRKYKYPKGGSSQLLKKLLIEINDKKILIKTNTEVNILSIGSKECVLNTNLGESIKCDEIILTSSASIDTIKTKKEEFLLKKTTTNSLHYNIVVDGLIPKKISYVRLMNHQFIHRVSDVSNFSETNSKIFCIGIFSEQVNNLLEEDIISKIKKELIKRSWISSDSVITDFFKTSYTTDSINHVQIKEINKLKELTVLRSTNFIYGLSNHIERWEPIILN